MKKLLFLICVFIATPSFAQDQVTFALVPKVGNGLTPATAFRPKYTDPGALGENLDLVGWSMMDYGLESVVLMRVVTTSAQRTALQSQIDTLVVPNNLDSQISALALTNLSNKLESVNLPAHWISAGMTYRQILRGFRRVITFMQRWRGIIGTRLFAAGVTLDTRLNQLTTQQRQHLANVADSFNLDRSAIVTTMTIREALKLLADQLDTDPIFDGE
jgi:hypothetical protein